MVRVTAALLVLCLFVSPASGQEKLSGLPFGLDYSMTKRHAQQTMQTLSQYKVSTPQGMIAYVIPDPATSTVNSLFLDFKDDRLMQIASVKSEMGEALYARYLEQLLQQAQKWVAQGVEKVWEDPKSKVYMYRDEKSVISISGRDEGGGKYTVSLTFKDRRASAIR